jgi:hypothetical protein
MSEPLPPELFGVPGTLNEWLSPDGEVETMERIDGIAEDIDRAGFPDSHEDGLWLAQTCRKLLEARIATRNAVVKMAADLANYEQGQGILGATP